MLDLSQQHESKRKKAALDQGFKLSDTGWVAQGGEVGRHLLWCSSLESRPNQVVEGEDSEDPEPTQLKRGKGGKMAFISKERESTGEDSTIPPSFMTYHDEVGL